MKLHTSQSTLRFSDERGVTLVETLIAMLILLFGLLAIAQVVSFGTIASKTFGRDTTKAAAFANDKMEELLALNFADTTTNITVNPPYPATGAGLAAGGSAPPGTPATNYVDYLDSEGVRTTAGTAAYVRQWQIIDDSASLKRIIVAVTSVRSFRMGPAQTTVLVTLKTS